MIAKWISMIFMVMAFAVPAITSALPNSSEETITLQLIAFNDFHGQLEPPSGNVVLYYNSTHDPFKIEAGGAAYLATQIKALKATNPNTVIVSAGDCISASPLISALFHDEPSVEALSEIGLAYSAAGNHEFDKGVSELKRMQYGCCNQEDGCQDGDRFTGAGYYYLTSNVIDNSTNTTLFPPYEIKYIEGVPVAFIGVSLESTASVVAPSGIRGLRFLDEADSINATVKELKEKGVETIIVLIHQGGSQEGLPSESKNLTGPIIDIVKRADKEVDVFVTGHTHKCYVSNIDGRIVTQAGSQGKFLTDIDLVISKDTGDVISATAKNVAVAKDVPQDPETSLLVEKYSALAEPKEREIIGSISADLLRNQSESGESSLGDVIADTQLYATREERTVIAFVNSGSIRTDLLYSPGENEGQGNVTYGEAFSVQPFSNSIIALNLTGKEIDRLLESQFDNPISPEYRTLQVSRGFSYTWNSSAPSGQKVDIKSIKINGSSIDPEASYRIAANSFLADGGDNFVVFKEGDDRICGVVDLDAFEEYFRAFSPVSPGPKDRIAVVS